MNILFLVESSLPSDEQRIVQTLMRNLPDDLNKHVIFTEGNTGHHQCQSMPNVAFEASFKTGEPDEVEVIAKFIGRHKIDTLVTFKNQFRTFRLLDVYAAANRHPKLVFIGAEHGGSVRQAASELSLLDPVYVAVSALIMENELQGFNPVILRPGVPRAEGEGRNIRLSLNIPPPPAKVIGYMGDVSSRCNFDLILEVARRTRSWVIICGLGPLLPAMFEAGNQVKVVPDIPELRGDWYDAMTCFVYPVRSSGIPTLALEAILHGVPTVMTPVGDMYRVFGDRIDLHGMDVEAMIRALNKAMDHPVPSALVEKVFNVEQFVEGFTALL